jgi:hypothetical protein
VVDSRHPTAETQEETLRTQQFPADRPESFIESVGGAVTSIRRLQDAEQGIELRPMPRAHHTTTSLPPGMVDRPYPVEPYRPKRPGSRPSAGPSLTPGGSTRATFLPGSPSTSRPGRSTEHPLETRVRHTQRSTGSWPRSRTRAVRSRPTASF